MRIATATWNANEQLQKATRARGLDFSTWFEPRKSEVDSFSQRGAPEIYAIAFQESVPLPLALTGLGAAQLTRYEHEIQDAVQRHAAAHHKVDEKHSGDYRLVKRVLTGAIALFVYANESIADQITNVQTASTGCGLLYMSNKGGVAVRFELQDSGASFTFVSCHLAPHNHNIARRNADYASLVSSLVFGSEQRQIYGTSYLFVMGDLNYRISTSHPERLSIRDIGQKLGDGNMEALLKHDQLAHELHAGKTLHGLKEGRITFPPTYKFIKGTDRYKNFGERLPGWTDRIMYAGSSDVQVEYYRCVPSARLSDHKPVKALFSIPSPSSSRLSTRTPFPIDPSRAQKHAFGVFLGRLVGAIWSILRTFGFGNAWIGAAFVLLHTAAVIAQFDYVKYAVETAKWIRNADLAKAYDDFTKAAIEKVQNTLDYSSEVYLGHK